MASLRRRWRRVRRATRLTRFHVATLLTMIVLAYAGVPHVARVVAGMSGYLNGHYEPKDAAREAWVPRAEDAEFVAGFPWSTVVNALLFVLVAVVWLTVVPTRMSRRPPPD
jgi:hypothetical protein